MAFTYSVAFSSVGANGPFTEAAGSPFTATTDVITGLNPATNYWFRIITNDTVTGGSSAPVISGPFATTAAGPQESIEGATVLDQTSQILASRTIGQPSTGTLDTWTLTAANGQAVLNGVTRTETAAITKLVYHNHTVFQTSPNGNALGTPGWWSWNGTGWTDEVQPVISGPALAINTIADQNTNTNFTIAGQIIGYNVAPVLQYQDTGGAFQSLPSGATVSATAFSFSHPAVVTPTTGMTVTVRDAGNTTVSKTSNSFAVSTPGVVTITGVSLSGTSFSAPAANGTTVGTISVATKGGAYSGTNTLTGTNASSFQIASNTTLQTKGTVNAGTYNFNIVATMGGAVGSPFTQAETVTGVAGPATGPGVSGNFINVDFTNKTGNTVSTYLWGSSMASDIDFTPWANSTLQNVAKTTAGFGLPGMYARINTNDTSMDGSGNPNLTFVDRVSSFMKNVLGLNDGSSFFSYNLGGRGASPSQFANGAKQIAQRFIANSSECMGWEVFNENDGLDMGTYTNIFNATADALHGINANYKVIGTCDSFMNGGRMQSLGSSSGTRLAAYCYHSYSVDDSFDDNSAMDRCIQRFGGDASGLRSSVSGTAGRSVPASVGEYNMTGNPPGIARQLDDRGAVFNILAMHTAFTNDPLTQFGAIWDWFGDGYYGYIIDPGNNPGNYPAFTVRPVGYAMKTCRQYVHGSQVATSVPGAGSRFKALATVNGTSFGVLLINYATTSTQSGQIALSHWPVNTTGNATIQRIEISSNNLTAVPASVTVTGGLVQSLSLPAMSVTVLTP